MTFQCTQNLVPLNAGLCNRENFPPLFFAKFPKIRNILRWPCQRNIYYRFPFLFLNKIHSSRLPEILFVAIDYFTCNKWLSVRLKAGITLRVLRKISASKFQMDEIPLSFLNLRQIEILTNKKEPSNVTETSHKTSTRFN